MSVTVAMARKIMVLGAGVVGLSTAVRIQEEIPGSVVTIVADKFTKETTSDGAAGMFRPTILLTPAPSEEIFGRWCEDSFRWYDVISRSDESPAAGIYPISGYELSMEKKEGGLYLFTVQMSRRKVDHPSQGEDAISMPAKYPHHHKIIYNFRDMTPREIHNFPGNYKYGFYYTTLMIECRRYQPWLTERFRKNGGKIISQTVTNLEEFTEKCDLLVNCSALGSRELFGDREMVPIRGHLIRLNNKPASAKCDGSADFCTCTKDANPPSVVKAPWIKHFLLADNANTYIYPGQDNVCLGGTRQEGIEDLTYEQVYFDDIMKRCCAFIPSLKTAKIEQQWVGLRPFRSVVRVESEEININGKTLKVVHNYGHGGNGVSLSWGTAVHATEIAKKMLQNTRSIPSSL